MVHKYKKALHTHTWPITLIPVQVLITLEQRFLDTVMAKVRLTAFLLFCFISGEYFLVQVKNLLVN